MVVPQGRSAHTRVAGLSYPFVAPFGILQGLPVLQFLWCTFGQSCVANAPRPMLIEAVFCYYAEAAEKHEARTLAGPRHVLAITVACTVP